MPKWTLFLILWLCCQNAVAQYQLNSEAHTHGLAELKILYESGQLMMELVTPSANFLGFEHTPQNETEWQRVRDLRQIISKPNQIMALTPECDLQAVEVDMPIAEKEPAKGSAEVKDYARPSEKQPEHKERQHDEPRSQNHQENHQEAHQDIHVQYEWRCKADGPPTINMHLLDRFSGFEKINVQWIINGKQGAGTFDKNNKAMEIKP